MKTKKSIYNTVFTYAVCALFLVLQTGVFAQANTQNPPPQQQQQPGIQQYPGMPQPSISFEKAREIAVQRAGGGFVSKIELDYEHGLLVYEIEVRNEGWEYEIDVNAQTGDVTRFKKDWD